MRYFFVSYYHSDIETRQQGYGHVYFEHDKFPSMDVIADNISYSITNMIVLNIMEFKNEQDYLDFKGNVPESELAYRRWENAIYALVMQQFNFSKDMIEVSLSKNDKPLKDYFDEGKNVKETIESIYKIKIEE